jgi:hypothetical protein
MKPSFGESKRGFGRRRAAFRHQRVSQLNASGSRSPDRKITHWIVAIVSLWAASCTTLQQVAEDSPPAKSPVLTGLQAAHSATGAFEPVTSDGLGAFNVLPSGEPSGVPRGAVKVFFTAPPLLTLKVDVDRTVLDKFAEVPAGLDPNVVGYYRVESVNESGEWQVTVRPPLSPIPRFALVINIATVSINPNYATFPNHESAPLAIRLTTRPFRIGIAGASFVNGPCITVPNLPELRPGLTVTTADPHITAMSFTRGPIGVVRYYTEGEVNSVAPANFPFHDLPKYSLVLRLGTQIVQSSSSGAKFVTNQAGKLEVCVNDDSLDDNGEAWSVDLRIEE